MSTARRNSAAAADWAQKKKEKMERAQALREARRQQQEERENAHTNVDNVPKAAPRAAPARINTDIPDSLDSHVDEHAVNTSARPAEVYDPPSPASPGNDSLMQHVNSEAAQPAVAAAMAMRSNNTSAGSSNGAWDRPPQEPAPPPSSGRRGKQPAEAYEPLEVALGPPRVRKFNNPGWNADTSVESEREAGEGGWEASPREPAARAGSGDARRRQLSDREQSWNHDTEVEGAAEAPAAPKRAMNSKLALLKNKMKRTSTPGAAAAEGAAPAAGHARAALELTSHPLGEDAASKGSSPWSGAGGMARQPHPEAPPPARAQAEGGSRARQAEAKGRQAEAAGPAWDDSSGRPLTMEEEMELWKQGAGAYTAPPPRTPDSAGAPRDRPPPQAPAEAPPARAAAKPASARQKRTVKAPARAPRPSSGASAPPPAQAPAPSAPPPPPSNVTFDDMPTKGTGMDIPEYEAPVALVECGGCGRRFNEKAYKVHQRVCKKVFQTKREAFDAAAARVPDLPDAQEILTKAKEDEKYEKRKAARKPPGRGAPKEQPISSKELSKPKWKQQSEAFRAQMKAAAAVKQAVAEGKDLKSLPPPEPTYDPSFVQCPHCLRRFNEQAAERHIPKCNSIKAKPKMLKRGSGQGCGVATHAGSAVSSLAPKSALAATSGAAMRESPAVGRAASGRALGATTGAPAHRGGGRSARH